MLQNRKETTMWVNIFSYSKSILLFAAKHIYRPEIPPKSISIVNKFRLSIWIFAHFCCLPGDIWLPLFTGYFFSFLQATVRFLNRCNIIWKMCTSRMHTPLYTPIIRYPNVHVYLSPPISDTNVCRHEASLQEAQHDNYNLCIQLVCPIRARPTHAQT